MKFVTYKCTICGGERSIPSDLTYDTGTAVTSLYPPCRMCGSVRFERIPPKPEQEAPAKPQGDPGATAT